MQLSSIEIARDNWDNTKSEILYQVNINRCKNVANSRRKKPGDSSRSLLRLDAIARAKFRDALFRNQFVMQRVAGGDCPEDSFCLSRGKVAMSYCEREGEARFVFAACKRKQDGETDSPKDNRSLGNTRLPGHNPFCSGSTDPPAKRAALTCSSQWLSSAKRSDVPLLSHDDDTR